MAYKLESNYTKEVLALLQKFWDPQRISKSGNLEKRLRIPRDFDLEASGIWLQNFHSSGETDSWRAQAKPCVQQGPAEGAVTPQEIELGLPVCPGLSGKVWVNSGLLQGQEQWLQQSWDLQHAGISPFEGDCH